MLEHPPLVELEPAVGRTSDGAEVPRAWIHREACLHRVPVVVLADQVVEVLEPPPAGQPTPAAREPLGVVAVSIQELAVGRVQAAVFGLENGLNLA